VELRNLRNGDASNKNIIVMNIMVFSDSAVPLRESAANQLLSVVPVLSIPESLTHSGATLAVVE
jgi:hypothetical protein